MRRHFNNNYRLFLISICIILGFAVSAQAQTFTFKTRDFSKKTHGVAMLSRSVPVIDTVTNSDDWIDLKSSSWLTNNKIKSARSFLKFYVDHYYDIKMNTAYMYKLCYKLKGYTDSLASPVTIYDTLVIGYNPDSLTAYQDRQEKSYDGFHRIIVEVTALFDIIDPLNPVAIATNDTLVINRNFILESAIMVQKYEKTQYGLGTTPVVSTAVSNGKLNITIKGPGNIDPPVPCNYELEWLYVDNYKDSVSSYTASQLDYDFRNNSTRVWLTENTYSIPIVYQDGFLIYRVRYVRPDQTSYRYPIYSKWSTPDKGTVNNSTNYQITPHKSDNLNWQYTVSFAEEGKYKQVMSYYDGLLKNRQTITRFNSLPNKVIVTENTYDYEGRPAIKTLPAPVTTSLFELQNDVTLNSVTSDPYKAADFDSKVSYTCPSEVVPPALSATALANIYYSKLNTDTVGYQKYVPDANGYPFTQTIFSPGYNDRIEKQGGAGDSLQIGTTHYTSYNYTGGDQTDLNRLMGTDVGWAGFYNKTVTEDPNGQLSMSVKDYKGKLVHTSMIGNVNYLKHSFDADTMAPGASIFEQDLIGNNPQQVIGDQRIMDHNFFMDASGVGSIQYIYSFKPYKTFCPNKYLSVASAYEYQLFDDCGDVKHDEADTLGVNGVVDSTVRSYPGTKHSVYLEKGKHSVHKELTVDMNNIYAAVDSFMILPDNCLKTVHNFIKEEVFERTYPCPSDETPDDPCIEKKKRMMDDLKPGGKYGGYYYWNDPTGKPWLTGTGSYDPAGNGGTLDGNKSVFDRDEYYNYRYQDPCITLPTIIKNGVTYTNTNLKNLTADQFRTIYTGTNADLIAAALLPLHPEYCRLQSCFVDTFKELYLTIPDAKTAESLGLLYIDDIISKDPITTMLSSSLGFASPNDSLNSFKGGKVFFDTLVTTLAYCSCTDSIMFQTCKNDIFKNEINSLLLVNDYVKEIYFKNMKQLYFQNRERFKNYQISGTTDNCGPCFSLDQRIKLVPPAHFTTYFTATGALDTTSPTSWWTSFVNAVNSTSTGGSFSSGPASVDTNFFVGMSNQNMDPDTLAAKLDSANKAYTIMDSLMAVGQSDSITARLANCFGADTNARNGIRSYLLNLYNTGKVRYGNFTPEQIRDAIVSESLSLDDLCNPYLLNYSDFILTSPGTNLLCKPSSYYSSLKVFLDNVIATGTLHSFTPSMVSLTSDAFDMEVKNRLGVTTTVDIVGQYETHGNLYTLKIYNPTDTIKIYLRGRATAGAGVCSTVFDNSGGVTIEVDDIRCIRDAVGGMGEGYVGNYAFTLTASRIDAITSNKTTCTLLGWNNDVEMARVTEDRLAACVPCTQMKSLYEEFADTLQTYKVWGVDHPYYNQMLRSFMNYKLGKRFTTDQYLRFIESCQLADSMEMERYVGYAHFEFPSDAAATTFVSYLNNLIPGKSVNDFYREQLTGSNYWVMINLNTVPREKQYLYRDAMLTQSGPVNRWVNKPYHHIDSGRIGFIHVPDSAYFIPNWSDILGFNINYPLYPTTYYDTANIQVLPSTLREGNAYIPHKVYLLNYPGNISPLIKSLVSYRINDYLTKNGIRATFVDHYHSTVDGDYFTYLKPELLQYIYGLQHLSPAEVLDSMQEDNLNAMVFNPGWTSVTYSNNAHPDNVTNLYITGVTVNKFKKVDTMLRRMIAVSGNGGRLTMPSGVNRIKESTTDSIFTAFRCSDGSYWYRYFGAGDTMFNIFFRLPKYIPKHRHYDFLPVSNTLVMKPGDSTSKNFSFKLRDTKLNALGVYDTLTIDGRSDFVISLNTTFKDVLLGDPIDGKITVADTFNHCERVRLSAAIYEGKWRYAQYIDSVREYLANEFYAHVMGGVFEALNLGYLDQRFQKTLYYYDRAGNLLKTVPPSGVVNLSSSMATLKKVDTLRKSNTVMNPAHKNVTVYNYNTRNQLVKQTTPDAGTTRFWYDAAGRLVFSQNQKQLEKGAYTYNLYDRQSRVVETGEVTMGCVYFDEYISDHHPNPEVVKCYNIRYTDLDSNLMIISPHPTVVTGVEYLTSDQVMTSIRQKYRRDVVLTVYDSAARNLAAVSGMSAQENLRKRVSAVKYFVNIAPVDTSFAKYDHTSYYSYDATGNVKTLTHDFPALERYRQRYKRVDYDYDVISGKVNMLSYNRGFADQFYQRYQYDDDNRISIVQTSADGYIWMRDAEYNYYQHGPLARMSLGDIRVQGVDYAYTIQGWLKAINSDIMTPIADMGKDAIDTNSVHAYDAFALTLDYFDGDYKPIGLDSFMHLSHAGKNLYNGNIARQTIGILPFDPLKTDYTYDQLHRIKYADYHSIDPVNKTMAAIDDYKSKYKYDQDGNITKLWRWGNNPTTGITGTATLMDSMNYYYANGAKPNRLTNVTDLASTTAFGNDIQPYTNTAATRFLYDAIGNTTKDLMNNQDNIIWNLYNKVTASVNNVAKTTLDFEYDGAGNRIAKRYDHPVDTIWKEDNDYYVRDAQGNILAVYKAERKYKMVPYQIYEDVAGEIRSGSGPLFYLDTLLTPWRDATFDVAIRDRIFLGSSTWLRTYVDSFPVSFYLAHGMKGDMLEGTTDYLPLLYNYNKDNSKTIIADAWNRTFEKNSGEANVLAWTQALFGEDDGHHAIEVFNLICEADNEEVVMPLLYDALGIPPGGASCYEKAGELMADFDNGKVPNLADGLLLAYTNYPEAMLNIFQSLSYAPAIFEDSYYIGSTTAFADMMRKCLSQKTDGTAEEDLYAFFDQWEDAREDLNGITPLTQLGDIAYAGNPTNYLATFGSDEGYGAIDSTVVNSSSFHIGALLKQVRKVLPTDIADQVDATLAASRVNISDRYWLAEHHLYGSSRLGIKHYWPNHFYNYWDYALSQSTPAVDTFTLQTRFPWYSAEQQDLIAYTSTTPYSARYTAPFSVQHTIGLKGYELNNHLGNVQAVVLDKRGFYELNEANRIEHYKPSLMAAYDYYPFGSLMPGRYVSDTGSQCAWVTQTKLMPSWAYLSIWEDWICEACGFEVVEDAMIEPIEPGTGSAALRVSANHLGAGAENTLTVTPETEESIIISTSDLAGQFMVYIDRWGGDGWINITTSEIVTPGDLILNFETGSSSQVRFRILNNTDGAAELWMLPWKRWKLTYTPQNVFVKVCDSVGDKYRFGWNTHEKVNEIAGIGNHTTAEFGEFDTRLGRRWNVDPVETVGVSPYAVNLNNPILYNDPDGDCPWCWSALIGGALDAGFQLATIAMSDDMTMSDFSWSSVGISMVAGATGYGLSTVVERNVAKMAAGKVVTAVVKTTADVGTDMAVGMAEDYAKTGKVNVGDALENAILGQGVGKVAEGIAEPIIKNSPEVKSLEKKAEQLERKAKNNPKESPNTNRNKEPKEAREKYNKKVANKVGRASTISSGAATKTKDLIKEQSNGSGGGKLQAPRPCFVAGTLVATNKGYQVIENIKDGDSVLTYNIANRKLEYQVVKDKHSSITDSIVTILLPNGEKIETTPIHSFYANEGKWIPAGQLTTKDIIWFANGTKGAITKISTTARQEVVYNFEVPITHNYFVSKAQILVHNSEQLKCK